MTTHDAQPATGPDDRPRRRWYTAELLGAYADGKEIVAGGLDQPVIYQPRTKYDPQPWVTVPQDQDQAVLRYNGRECYARDPQTAQSADTRPNEQQKGAA